MMNKSLIFSTVAYAIFCLSGCTTVLNLPPGKNQQDFYNDLNECGAIGMRIEGMSKGTIATNCMLGKGYTIQR